MEQRKKKRRRGLRIDIIIIFSLIIMFITFFAYMLSTSLEDVLEKERGENVIITHSQGEKNHSQSETDISESSDGW